MTFISFIFPAGGAILTLRNLQRLRQVDDSTARSLVWAAVGIFALGLTILLLLAPRDSSGLPQVDANAEVVIAAGTAVASYVVQRNPFRQWRTANARTRTSPWLHGFGLAVIYEILTVFITALAVGITGAVATTALVFF
ncbi:MAG: hypothetical protein ACR2GA_02610 [Chloroflexota bacterium]